MWSYHQEAYNNKAVSASCYIYPIRCNSMVEDKFCCKNFCENEKTMDQSTLLQIDDRDEKIVASSDESNANNVDCKIEEKIIDINEKIKVEENDIFIEDVTLYDHFATSLIINRENLMGMTVTSGSVTITKDPNNLIGISIGGGAPLCPCLYIVQIFDNTATARDGTLQAGDELVAVNGQSVKGKTKVEVAKMIQATKDQVVINYNKLHADPQQGKTLDIVLKKVKHRIVEHMSSSTADALGLSRAILCNDTLVKKMQELQDTELMYKGLVDHCKRVLHMHLDLMQMMKAMGDVFSNIAIREPQPRASEAFRNFGEQHRSMEKIGSEMVKKVKPVLGDMGTYLHKAIPDTRLTVKKYADAKFEYLAYCLKVKEMDDEECNYAALQEPLYRVETGNYEYRLILRCRQVAREKFAKLRSDVLVKMELLENKHVQSLGGHLTKLVEAFAELHKKIMELLSGHPLFPVEVDLSNSAFQYKSTTPITTDNDEDNEIENGEELQENSKSEIINSSLLDEDFSQESETTSLIPELETISQIEPNYDQMDNLTLLSCLNLNDDKNKEDDKLLDITTNS